MWSEWSVILLVPCYLLHLSKRTWITFPTSPFLFSVYRKSIWLSFLCRLKPMDLYRVSEWAINGISVSSFFIREIHFSPKQCSRRVAKQLEFKKKKNTQNPANNVILSCGDLSLYVHYACCWLTSSEIESVGSFAFGCFWALGILFKAWFQIVIHWQHSKGGSVRLFL